MGADGAATGGLRLGDPDAFLDGVPFEELAELRRSTPVLWQDLDGQPGFWAVLRHADVVTVARRTDVFSASLGGIVVEDMDPETLEMVRGVLLAMDPPRHNVYRTPLADTFRAAVMATLEPTIRSICREIMERAAELLRLEAPVGERCARCLASEAEDVCGRCGRPSSAQRRVSGAIVVATAELLPDVATLYTYDPGIAAFAPVVVGCRLAPPPSAYGPLFDPR